ncbi:MAG: carbon-nitrogen hydrolase family protein [Deltaproteobacteria bacterium]|nr:carbon-nitrogen hydrolase family protein [Deltaproteobacteria bacterium]
MNHCLLQILQPTLKREDHQHNLTTLLEMVPKRLVQKTEASFLVLPELFFRTEDRIGYERFIREIATMSGACVIGGSLHTDWHGKKVNTGIVADPDGEIIGRYFKNNPYGPEVKQGIKGVPGLCQFSWRGWRGAVVICADAWDSRLLNRLQEPPDLLFIVAESVSEEHGPVAARSLWHSLAVARAFELTSVVAISDWGEGKTRDGDWTCGVGGMANPADPTGVFHPIPPEESSRLFTIDREGLKRHREARRSRSFYWFKK